MNFLIKLPNDIFKHEIMQYLTVYDIVNVDNSILNRKFRNIYLNIMKGMIIISKNYENQLLFLEWVIKKEMYIRNIYLVSSYELEPSSLFLNYISSFKFVQNLHIDNGFKNRCWKSNGHYYRTIYDNYCVGVCFDSTKLFFNNKDWTALMSLQIYDCQWIEDKHVQDITVNCSNLLYLTICNCRLLTNNSMLNLINNKSKLQQLNIQFSLTITDFVIVIMLKNACFTIQSLRLQHCPLITDKSIQYLGQYCKQLKCLKLFSCVSITSSSIIFFLNNNITLTSLTVLDCIQIKHKNIMIILNHCNFVNSLFLASLTTKIQR